MAHGGGHELDPGRHAGGPPRDAVAGAARPRRRLRTAAFAAVRAYGVERWGGLLAHPPMWRLYGRAALAVAFAVLVPLAGGSAPGPTTAAGWGAWPPGS